MKIFKKITLQVHTIITNKDEKDLIAFYFMSMIYLQTSTCGKKYSSDNTMTK